MQHFYKLWLLNNDQDKEYSSYMPTLESCIRHARAAAKEGYDYGHISKYTDTGSCYLMDLKFGKDGFLDFEVKEDEFLTR